MELIIKNKTLELEILNLVAEKVQKIENPNKLAEEPIKLTEKLAENLNKLAEK